MLKPITSSQGSKGFDSPVEAGRLDLLLEALVLQKRFRPLFGSEELKMAKIQLKTKNDWRKQKHAISRVVFLKSSDPGKPIPKEWLAEQCQSP
jgi:hypothetical protein